MISRASARHGVWLLLVLAAGGVIESLSEARTIRQDILLAAMTVLMLSYLFTELKSLRRSDPDRWWVNPVVLTSVITFIISFGVTNAVYFLPAHMLRVVHTTTQVTPAMVKLMWLVLLSAIAMWLGYRSQVGLRVASAASRLSGRRWIRSTSKPHLFAIPVLALIALLARLVQVKLGVFGYASSYQQLMDAGRYTQYLAMFASLGSLSLLLAAMVHYRHPTSPYYRFLLIACLVLEVGFGLLSGFKSLTALPFVIVGVCRYLNRGRIPVMWVLGFLVSLLLAYVVIEPYRHLQRSDYSTGGNSVSAIADTMTNAQGGTVGASNDRAPAWLGILARSSLLYVGSLGIAYKDSNGALPAGSPDFLKNLAMSPAYAFLPRALFPGKPSGTLGMWYTHVIMDDPVMSATDATPFTYLYFAGGIVAIIGFFLALGVYQRAIWVVLRPTESIAGALVFLVLLATVAQIPSAVDGMLIQIFRTIPILLVMQLLLFPRHTRDRRLHMAPRLAHKTKMGGTLVPHSATPGDPPHKDGMASGSASAGRSRA